MRRIPFPWLLLALAAPVGVAATMHFSKWIVPGHHARRTSFGDPDLQGLWTNESSTNLERIDGFPDLVFPESRVAEFRRAVRKRHFSGVDFTETDPTSPRKQRDMVGYNKFWTDPPSPPALIHGERRSSWIVDPPDGKVPYRGDVVEARRGALARRLPFRSGPESLCVPCRCLLGFGSTSGPPMLNLEQNNTYQIVQAPGYVAIVVEMVHDTRLIRLGGSHLPPEMRPWMGDSIGHWEGETLVVETTNVHPDQGWTIAPRRRAYISPDAKVTEWFTRTSGDEILYQFLVEDPAVYTRPWRGEIPMRTATGPMFEYACHEGNRSMENVLRGARYEDRIGHAGKGSP